MKINRETIIELEHKLIDAISTSNIKFLDSILHDDLLFVAPNGAVITKQMDLASHKAGDMVVEKISPNIVELRIIENSAIVVIDYETKGKMLGKSIEGQFRYIRIWQLFKDELKVIGGSCFKL